MVQHATYLELCHQGFHSVKEYRGVDMCNSLVIKFLFQAAHCAVELWGLDHRPWDNSNLIPMEFRYKVVFPFVPNNFLEFERESARKLSVHVAQVKRFAHSLTISRT